MGFVSDIFGGDEPDNSAQVRANEDSLALQRRMYDEGVARNQPFYDAGVTSLNSLMDYLGLSENTGAEGYGSLLTPFSLDLFQESPSYQYNLSESEKALERALASKGQFASMNPAASKALMSNASNLASNEYQNAYNNYNTDNTNIYNRLAGLMGYGQSAANSSNSLGSNYADDASTLYQNIGNLKVAQNEAESAWGRSMFDDIASTLTGGISSYNKAAMFSDKNLKQNIKKVGEKNGFNLYEFNYVWSPKKWIGVIAQEVQKVNPKAVCKIGNYLAVYYDLLGIEMEAA